MGTVCPAGRRVGRGGSGGGGGHLVGRPALEALVVHLAVGRSADRVDRQHPLGRLVGGELALHVGDDLGLVEGRPGSELDHRRDRLTELLVGQRSEEHTSELQSLMRISYAVFCLKKKSLQTSRAKY